MGSMNERPNRLPQIDGLRGLASLFVCQVHLLYHVNGVICPGRWAVVLFIVISGYCLMLPTERAGGLPGGLSGFAVRRVRRIMPAYYAAIALAILLGMQTTPQCLFAHLLLIHNWNSSWIFELNGPLWSMATEWQIYFVFALVLVPVWQKLGRVAAVATALALSCCLLIFGGDALQRACPQFLFFYSLGMAAVWIKPQRWHLPAVLPLVAIATVTWLRWHGPVDAALVGPGPVQWFYPANDAIIGAAAMLLIIGTKTDNIVTRCLSVRPIVMLGAFSYSLYVVHAPIISRFGSVPWPIVDVGMFLFAYLFYLVFERPYLTAARRTALIPTGSADS